MISFTVSSFPTVVIWMIRRAGEGPTARLAVRRALMTPTSIIEMQSSGVSHAMTISVGIVGSPCLGGFVTLFDR